MSSADYPAYVPRNVEIWTEKNAEYTDRTAAAAWAKEEITWGIFEIPESSVNVFGDVDGLDIVELGCGTAYVSAWLAKRGGRVTGLDPTPAQLATARRLQEETGLAFALVEGVAEDVPLDDASFDLAVSAYGASIFADPYNWMPKAAQLLRPGGRLIFLRNSTIAIVCQDYDVVREHLVRPLRGLHGLEWDDTHEVEFHLPHGELIDVLRESGFEVQRLVELYAPDDAATHEYYGYVNAEWAQKWPAEEIWVARKQQ